MSEVDKKWMAVLELFEAEPDSFCSLQTLEDEFKRALEDYGAAVRAETIEECAKVCDRRSLLDSSGSRGSHFRQTAREIRALKDTNALEELSEHSPT